LFEIAIGPTFGGGLSRLQGNYGMAIDNLISARIITAHGKAITVSEMENTDLWWGTHLNLPSSWLVTSLTNPAIRGAGQSFGIVSNIKVKVHP
jgi:hypothetical protein